MNFTQYFHSRILAYVSLYRNISQLPFKIEVRTINCITLRVVLIHSFFVNLPQNILFHYSIIMEIIMMICYLNCLMIHFANLIITNNSLNNHYLNRKFLSAILQPIIAQDIMLGVF